MTWKSFKSYIKIVSPTILGALIGSIIVSVGIELFREGELFLFSNIIKLFLFSFGIHMICVIMAFIVVCIIEKIKKFYNKRKFDA